MNWSLVATFLISSLFTAGIVFAALWLGWTARDRVGDALHEAYVGPVGLPETPEPSITLEDFTSGALDEEDKEY